MAGDLNQEQIALVLRRAAELDRETACPPGTGLDEISLEHAAVEAGISPLSVRRALAELRAGVLDRPEGTSATARPGPSARGSTRGSGAASTAASRAG
ncbi:MAG: hypothetical protein LC733_13640 [Actinobacteria bacterium]|nr:hypothetical protein [Actinomycetota bacterium]